MPATRQFMTNWSVPASQPHPAPQQGFPDGAKQAEIWVETKASGGDDKFYYYNVKTRETTWTRPEGPNIKIMQQSQVDLLAKSTMGPGAGAGPGPGGAAVPPVAFSMPPPFGMPPPGAWPPNPGPWPNAAGGPPGMPPPWAAGVGGQPPAPSMMAAAAAASKKLYPNDALIMSKVDKKILEAAAEWTEHRAPDGRFYFYNTKRGDSVWEKPSALRDLELAKAAVAQALSVINKEPPGMKMTGDFASNVNNVQRNNNRSLPASMVPGMSAPIAKKTPQTAQKSNAVADKSKPVQSTPVPGTPWCVVWTGDGRVFFYNPSTKTSIWERPEELIGRNEVDKLVTTPPPSVTVDASSSSTAAAAAAAVAARLAASSSTAAAAPAALARKRVQNENDSDASSDSDSDPEPEPKRSRSDLFMGASGGRQPQNVTKTDTTTNNNDGGEDLMAPGTSDLTLPLTATTTTSTETADETSAATAATTENGHANAVDMEVQAARDRATIPLDDRIKSFREMLVEKDVSAFSTWEKELHKIVFDRRYLLLTSRERKQVFDRYVKDRAEEERKEKRQKIKEKREAFKRLLSDANLTGKYSKDERYRNIEKLREREELFTDYVTNLRRKEKEDKIQRRESARKEFTEMLKENTEIERYSHWIDVKKRFESDSRYRAVESSSMRELWFKDYCRTLQQLPYKDERKKNKEQRSRTAGDDQHREKDKDRERKHHHHHHHRDSKKSSAITNDSNNTENWDDDDNGGGGGVEVLDSKRDKNKDGKKSSKSKSSGDKSTSNQNDDVNGHKDGDGDAMENGDLNGTRTEDKNGRNEDEEVEEEEEEEGCIADSDENDDDAADATANNKNRQHLVDYELEDGEEIGDEKEFDEAEREKRARTEASLREREKEVQRTLASHLRDRDKEREQHQQSEAVEQFKALLVDCVRSSEMTWKEAKKAMKKDGTRWQLVEILSRDDRDRLFNDHHEHLFKKKREKFRELLDETVPQLAAGAVWKDLKKAIKDDPRYVKFGSSDKCEREYRDYVRDRTNQEKHDFRELLAETKLLTHKSLELFADKSDAYLQEIEEVLKKDQRYHKMDHIPSERRQFIINYIEDLAKKGPPPPPTATNDKSRRLK